MELMAAIRALERISPGPKIRIFTDSQYVQKGMTAWIHGWIDRGWRTADGKPVQNRDLWERLQDVADRHRIDWHWVRGHNGHPGNEKAHRLAEAAARKGA
jgi:ribonuclease HI